MRQRKVEPNKREFRSGILRRSGVSVCLVCDRLEWEPSTIYQIGVGQYHKEVDVFREAWPGVELHGVEAHPGIYESLKGKYPGKLYGYAVVANSCIGFTDFVIKKHHGDGSSLLLDPDGQKGFETVRVQAYTIQEIFGMDSNVDSMLWLDCEGAETAALAGAGTFLDHVEVINVEMTPKPPPDFKSYAKPVDIFEFLVDRGYFLQWIHTQRGTQYDAIFVSTRLFRPEFCCVPQEVMRWNEEEL